MTRRAVSSSDAIWSASDLAEDPHRVADKGDRVRAMFSGIADHYDLNNRVHSLGLDQAWRARAVRLAGVGSGDHVLDVACGTGDLAEAFARVKPAAVRGIDFTPRMIELACEKATRRRRRSGVPVPAYDVGDAMALPFDDASFDIVSIAFGIRNVSEPDRALAEFRRVLRPAGRLVILEFSRPRRRLLRWLNAAYCERIMPITATLIARDRSGAYRYLPRSVATFLDREALVASCEAAGFADVEQHEMTLGVCMAYIGHVPGDPASAG